MEVAVLQQLPECALNASVCTTCRDTSVCGTVCMRQCVAATYTSTKSVMLSPASCIAALLVSLTPSMNSCRQHMPHTNVIATWPMFPSSWPDPSPQPQPHPLPQTLPQVWPRQGPHSCSHLLTHHVQQLIFWENNSGRLSHTPW